MEIQAHSHPSNLWSGREVLAMLVVLAPIAFGNEYFDFLANQFATVIPK
jgi:hypothetical protein